MCRPIVGFYLSREGNLSHMARLKGSHLKLKYIMILSYWLLSPNIFGFFHSWKLHSKYIYLYQNSHVVQLQILWYTSRYRIIDIDFHDNDIIGNPFMCIKRWKAWVMHSYSGQLSFDHIIIILFFPLHVSSIGFGTM